MKKFITILALGLTAFSGNVVAQNGELQFTTFQGVGVVGGRAFDSGGAALSGNFLSDILFTPTTGSSAATASASFGSGAFLGYVVDGTVAVLGGGLGASGTYVQRAWDGAFSSYAAAVSAGAAYGNSFDHALPGQTGIAPAITLSNPSASPATVGGNTVGHADFALVPEPTTMVLGLMGLGSLVAARRRQK
jgi:hypothetical protein